MATLYLVQQTKLFCLKNEAEMDLTMKHCILFENILSIRINHAIDPILIHLLYCFTTFITFSFLDFLTQSNTHCLTYGRID